jgi:hypothetical protein
MAALIEALRGQFEEHHVFMLRMLLDTIDFLTVQIDKFTARITVKFSDLTLLATENNDPDDDGPGQGLLIPLTDVELKHSSTRCFFAQARILAPL